MSQPKTNVDVGNLIEITFWGAVIIIGLITISSI